MAGKGSRFAHSEYDTPKVLIDISGKPMYLHALESLGLAGKVIAVTQSSHSIAIDNAIVIKTDKVLQGAVMSAMLAKEHIDNEDELIVMNADQIIEWDPGMIENAKAYDGALLLFNAIGNRWSFARVLDSLIIEVAEKKEISTHALAGVHYWKRGSDFVKYAQEMIEEQDLTNNEYYVAPIYNYAIKDGKKIMPIFIKQMYDLGTPEALTNYLSDII